MIGWLLSVGLFVHGVSIFGNANYRVEHADGQTRMTSAGNIAGSISIITSMAFALWFYIQGVPIASAESSYSYGGGYSGAAVDPATAIETEKSASEAMAEAEAAADAAEAAANAAMKAAGE